MAFLEEKKPENKKQKEGQDMRKTRLLQIWAVAGGLSAGCTSQAPITNTAETSPIVNSPKTAPPSQERQIFSKDTLVSRPPVVEKPVVEEPIAEMVETPSETKPSSTETATPTDLGTATASPFNEVATEAPKAKKAKKRVKKRRQKKKAGKSGRQKLKFDPNSTDPLGGLSL